MRILPLSFIPSILPFVVFAAALSGQVVKPATTQVVPVFADAYAAESYVVQRLENVHAMNADGTGYRLCTVAVKVQSEAAVRSFGVVNVAFASASEKVEFQYVRVRRADGTVVESSLADVQEQPAPVTREAPFYSDLKEKQLPVKSLRVGDTLEWQAKIIRTKAEAPGEFWGQESFVDEGIALGQVVELRFPSSLTVNVWTNPAGGKPEETADGDQRVYRWKYSSIHPTTGAAAEAEKKLKEKKVLTADEELDPTEGKLPSVAWTTFKSWEAVGAWYRTLEGTRMQPDEAVKAKVAELTAGKKTEEEKVQAVYAYVSSNVRYIGVALGIGRYQPHHAEEVLDNQYGDCKDKHTLLAAMLTALGLHPDAVLIGQQIRFNPAVPSPNSFNHLITRVQVAGAPVWLDSTAEVAPYKMLTAPTRDKQALVVPETGAAKVERTPVDPPFASFAEMKAVGTLDKTGHSESKFDLTVRGDTELFLRAVLHQVAPAQYEEFMKRFLGGMGYGGTPSHVEIGRPEDTAGPLVFHYDYTRDKAGNWDQLQTIPQLLIVALPLVDEKEPPILSINLGWPRTEHSSAEMKLPEGWRVELPEAIHAAASFATYDITFRFDKGTLSADRKLVILKEKIPASEWKSYKTWQDKVSPGSEPYVQLIRNSGKNGDKAAIKAEGKGLPKPPQNEEAAELIKKAVAAAQEKDIDTAKTLLDQAKALNDRQRSLWAAMGFLQWLLGAPTEAIADYRRELELYPDSYGIYDQIDRVLSGANRRDEARENLRKWAAADSGNPDPARRLMLTLQAEGDINGAVAVGETALKNLPEDQRDNEPFLLELGAVQLKGSSPEKGHATLLAVLKKTEDVHTMNDAAYYLAEAGFEYPLAESKEREVLERLTAESRTWTLDEAPQTLFGKSSLLSASWDTLGWILYREGKTAEAATYIEAAWLNSLHPEVGEHLGDVKLALHDADGALKAFELALGEFARTDNYGNPRKPSTQEKALTERIEVRAGAKSSFADAKALAEARQQLRILWSGPAEGLSGTAMYRLLIGKDGVERALPLEETVVEGGAPMLEKLKLAQLFPAGADAKLAHVVKLKCADKVCAVELQF